MKIIDNNEVAKRLVFEYLEIINKLSIDSSNICFNFNNRFQQNILNEEHIDKIDEIIKTLENQKKYCKTGKGVKWKLRNI